MTKRVYSIVLSDDVVAAVDSMAYSMNTSRSNLINEILAKHCSYITPERQIRDIFDYVEQNLADYFRIVEKGSSTIFSAAAAINYKYNPTAKYSLELIRRQGRISGLLRVSFRTQSREFMNYLSVFFKIWSGIETALYGENLWETGENRFIRSVTPGNSFEKEISSYINMLDRCLKIFFANTEDLSIASALIRKEYYRRYDI